MRKRRLAYSVTARVLALYKVLSLKYKAGLNRIKFVCVAMCSLMMSLSSHDLPVMSLIAITTHWFNLHSAWFLDGNTSTCNIIV